MRLELVLQIAIALMCALSAILLSMGERQPLLGVVAAMMSACAVYFNDLHGWVRLRTKGENVACLIAVAIALFDLWRFGADSQLLAAANLLVYLQFVLLFQQKTLRRYWMLALLSLMQVAVAAALGLDLSFGLVLFGYLLLSLGTLSLFFAHREISRYSPQAAGEGLPAAANWRLNRRSGLRSGVLNFTQPPGASAISSSTVGVDEPVSWRYGRLVSLMSVSALALAFVLFFLIPRFEKSPWPRARTTTASIVGIPETVSLREVGRIYENPEAVMRVSFRDSQNRIYELREPPLFRGFHLTVYDDNRWRETTEPNPVSMSIEELTGATNHIFQELEVRPTDNEVLFHAGWPVQLTSQSELLVDFARERILRPHRDINQYRKYALATTSFENGRQSRFTPVTRPPRDAYALLPYLHVPRSLTRLPDIAAEAAAGIDPDDKLALIKAVNDYLVDPERFAYSLQSSRRDPSMDAVEDFLVNNRQGHCEYFASAMTLMLRSLNIPARMAIGYKGDEYNALGYFYQVRQLHAHAWVEAYLTFDELPASLRSRGGEWAGGAWYTVDPSPISRVDEIHATTAMQFLTLWQLADYARYLWSGYVMGMDAQRQRSLYEFPLVAAKNLADRKFWINLPGEAEDFIWGDGGPAVNGWFNRRVALAAVLMAIATAIAGQLLWRRIRGRWRRTAAGRASTAPPPRAETLLFRRLESILARRDFHRPHGQTPLEYATAARGHLARSPATRTVANLPRGVVDSFYRLRFAGQGLDKDELHLLEQSLARLEAAIAAGDNPAGAQQA